MLNTWCSIARFWNAERAGLEVAVGRSVVPEDVLDLLCGPVRDELPDDPVRRRGLLSAVKIHGDLFKEIVKSIMGSKEDLERQRQREAILN